MVENNKDNKKFPIWIIVLIAVVVGALIWGVLTNNSLIAKEEAVTKDAAQIETQLQRRVDLIPNLVNTVKGYAEHEKEVFTDVANARTELATAMSGKDMQKISTASNQMDASIGRLMAISESYPDLKASANFIGLQDELAGTENRINQARQTYNDSVSKYNKSIKMFPASIIAGMNGFENKKYFEATAGADKVPDVKF